MVIANIIKVIDSINKNVSKVFINIATVLLFIMTSSIVLQVFLRYFFNKPLSWPEELSVYLMLWMSYLALPYLVYSNKNVSMTLLSDKFKNTPFRHIFDIFYVSVIIFVGFTWYPFAIKAVKDGMIVSLNQIPFGNIGVVQFIVPLSLFFTMFIAAQKFFVSLCFLFKKEELVSKIFVDPFANTQDGSDLQ